MFGKGCDRLTIALKLLDKLSASPDPIEKKLDATRRAIPRVPPTRCIFFVSTNQEYIYKHVNIGTCLSVGAALDWTNAVFVIFGHDQLDSKFSCNGVNKVGMIL